MNPSKFVPLLLSLSIFLGACAPAVPAPTSALSPTPAPSTTRLAPSIATPTETFTLPPTLTASPTNLPTASSGGDPAQATTGLPGMNVLPTWTPQGGAGATPQGGASATPPAPTSAPRLPAEKWQEWPVIPTLTATFVETYRKGLALGNNPHTFSKIGDCQSVVAAFLGIYDQPGVYSLPKGQEYLQDTIDWFKSSWGRESQAVRGGFNVASVLSVFLADPAQCKSGETPLDCEFRQNKPSIVLISMETGFEGRTAAVYEKYMRKIIEYVLAHGAAPILATKADDFEGDQSINLTTARLALEYDLPLWNFWRAVQPLPDHGMDMVRNDRFHISVEAWNVRSYTALQVLDALWKAVK